MSHTLQTPWYNKTIKALQLAGKGDKTQESYARSVRQLIEYVKNPLCQDRCRLPIMGFV